MVSETGEWITRGTVWIAVACYLWRAFVDLRAAASRTPSPDRVLSPTRAVWTLGFVAYAAHVLAAFHWYHGWSHAAAWEHTAERTAAATGFRWGGGLLFNHALTLLWAVDVALWWFRGLRFPNRHRAALAVLHAFFAFMVVNATVVFGPAYWRPVGLVVAVSSGIAWHLWRRRSGGRSSRRTARDLGGRSSR